MALFEFQCESCQHRFEEIVSPSVPSGELGKCPKCHAKSARKLISRFAVGGQGDLRESTLHGCHDCSVEGPHTEGGSHSSHSDD